MPLSSGGARGASDDLSMTSDCPSHQVELEETMHAQIGRVVAAKGREGDRLQREIDRLKAVHDLALREGMPGRLHETK